MFRTASKNLFLLMLFVAIASILAPVSFAGGPYPVAGIPLGKTSTANLTLLRGMEVVDSQRPDNIYKLVKANASIPVNSTLMWVDHSACTVQPATANTRELCGIADQGLSSAVASGTWFYAQVSGLAVAKFDDNGVDLSDGVAVYASSTGSAGIQTTADLSVSTASITSATGITQAANSTSTNPGLQTTLNALITKYNTLVTLTTELKADVNTNKTALDSTVTRLNLNNTSALSTLGVVELATPYTAATASGSQFWLRLRLKK